MKVRVYVDARNDFLFENIDKVIDGVRDSAVVSEKVAGRLVLMRQRKIPKNAEITTKEPISDTVAVFNQWIFWKQVDEPQNQSSEMLDTKEELKRLGSKDLRKLSNILRRIVSTNTSDGLYAYGLMVYVSDEMKRRQKKEFNPDIPSTGHL